MIEVTGLRFHYAPSTRWALDGVSLSIAAGESVLLVGKSGSGKSTLLRCLNGLVPHFHGGDFGGEVLIGGRDTRSYQPRDLADSVGFVFQDPESQIVAETVEDEITFGMENMRLPPGTIQKRVEEVLDQVHIAELRNRRLDTLSGGELQRVAIASVLTMQPQVLLLDEPTSQLDPQSAEELLTVVQRLNEELGLTIVIAEHRLERVVQYVDKVIYLPGDGSARWMDVREAMATLPLAPPVSRVGRALGWNPVPLSVKEGRKFAPARRGAADAARDKDRRDDEPTIVVRDLYAHLGATFSLRVASFDAWSGETVAVMGRNGAGKTSLLRSLVGLVEIQGGTVRIAQGNPREVSTERLARDVAFVPQELSGVLYHRTVAEEVVDTLGGTGREGSLEDALSEWELETLRDADPADLSAGERQRTALAAMCAGDPGVILLDEPTRGMDYDTKEMLARNMRRRCRAGATVLLASHDVELVAACADRLILMAEGQVAVEGSVRSVLTDTLTFSTQVNKLFGGALLTPEDVFKEMRGAGRCASV